MDRVVKICSTSLGPLDLWALERTGSPIRRCGACQPPGPSDRGKCDWPQGTAPFAETIMSS